MTKSTPLDWPLIMVTLDVGTILSTWKFPLASHSYLFFVHSPPAKIRLMGTSKTPSSRPRSPLTSHKIYCANSLSICRKKARKGKRKRKRRMATWAPDSPPTGRRLKTPTNLCRLLKLKQPARSGGRIMLPLRKSMFPTYALLSCFNVLPVF